MLCQILPIYTKGISCGELVKMESMLLRTTVTGVTFVIYRSDKACIASMVKSIRTLCVALDWFTAVLMDPKGKTRHVLSLSVKTNPDPEAVSTYSTL